MDMNNYAAYEYMKQQKRKEQLKQENLFRSIQERLQREAESLAHVPKDDSKRIDLLRDIPGSSWSDLMALKPRIDLMVQYSGSWCPQNVNAVYDPYGQTVVLKRKEN